MARSVPGRDFLTVASCRRSGALVKTSDSASVDRIRELARKVRQHVVQMTHNAKTSHVGSSLSCTDILATLYGAVLRYDPANPRMPDRDRLVISKGHAAAAVYATLAEAGFFDPAELDQYCQNGSRFFGHVTHGKVPGVELSSGSLGHGLSVSCGMALALKRQGKPGRVFCLMSDGECDEGSNWEAILFAPHHKLDNLTVIVDYNHIQSLGATKDILDLEPFEGKWKAFNWGVRTVDGHDVPGLLATLGELPLKPGAPTCIIANTIKGKGVSFMENTVLWHYRCPTDDDLAKAKKELGNS
jgi:transketolase